MPWERVERIGFRELASSSGEYGGEKLKKEELHALREMFETRKREELKWVLDDDVEIKEEWFDGENRVSDPTKRRRGEGEVIQFLVERLSGTEFSLDWKLWRMMKQSGLEFTEGQVLKVLNGLGAKKCWKQALSVVEWVYKDGGNKHCKSSYVVVDAADPDNLSTSRGELHDLLSKSSLNGIPLLILGNKIDKPGALSKQALTDEMQDTSWGLKSNTDRELCCSMISCKNSTNIDSVIDWLLKHSKSKGWVSSSLWL